MKKIILAASIAAALSFPMLAQAESTFQNPAVTGNAVTGKADARLDFTIVIPQVLFLRVGTSSGNTATDPSIDGIVYTVPGANVGDASVITGVGGDIGAGAVTVRAYGNGGNISLNSNTTGPLTTGTAGEVIPWSQVSVASAALGTTTPGFTNAAIAHPAFNLAAAGGPGTATTLSATNKIVRVEGRWTYTYLNANAVAAGTYGGTVAKNGRVTYTVTQL